MAHKTSLSGPQALTDLRDALVLLPPSGDTGFEGLLANVLSHITGHDFRLAGSGAQHGKDGGADNGVVFEAKRYDSAIPTPEVLTKVAELITLDRPPDLWILGATVGVKTQLADKLERLARRGSMSVLKLDWPAASALPPLALACCMAPSETARFLANKGMSPAIIAAASAAMGHLATDPAFAERSQALRSALTASGLAWTNARRENAEWLERTFADRRRAKAAFGQALAPGASHAMPTVPRADLSKSLTDAIGQATSGEVVVLAAAEGNGKSWAFAQSWLDWPVKPLTILVPASAFRPEVAYSPVESVILNWLVQETGEGVSDEAVDRWRNRLSPHERGHDAPARFIVCIDGLNERPDFQWPRWIDGAAAWIADRGGVLVLTARRRFFDDHVKPSLVSDAKLIEVPEWSDEELDALLQAKGVVGSELALPVRRRLRNPRIMGIAFDLLNSAAISTFKALSVDQLLFEHIRRSAAEADAPETAIAFAKQLAQQAQEVLARIAANADEPLVFERESREPGDYPLNAGLRAVSGETFFVPLGDDPTLYTLTNDGLALALGLAIVRALQKANRTRRDLAEALSALIEPIEALDKTAEAVFAATVIAAYDPNCSDAQRRVLMAGLLRLQNLDGDRFDAFAGVVRNAPVAALAALSDLVQEVAHAAHQHWLVHALRRGRDHAPVWQAIAQTVPQWLGAWTSAPELGVFTHQADNAEKHAEEIEARRVRLANREEELPPAEREFRERQMHLHAAGDPGDLYSAAFELLAGRALAPFANALTACAYAMAYNASIHAPHDGLIELIRFNRVDWSNARDALLEASAFASLPEASKTARWMRVEILRGTTTASDAEEAHRIYETLTADREKWVGGRLVERYSATDPCDPAASEPEGFDATAKRYEDLDVAALSATRFSGEADHFLNDARPSVARFRPEIAADVHRRFAESLPGRETLGQWLGITSFKPHAVLLEGASMTALRALACRDKTVEEGGDTDDLRQAGLVPQFALMALLPHLEGVDQIDLLRHLAHARSPILDLANGFHPGPSDSVDALLSEAAAYSGSNPKLMALLYVRAANPPLSEAARETVRDLASNDCTTVRALALGVLARCGDEPGLRRLVESGWSAADLTADDRYFEAWYGSRALLRAGTLGLIAPADVVARSADEALDSVLQTLGAPAATAVVARLESAMATLLDASPTLVAPPVEQDDGETDAPPLYSMGDLTTADEKRDFVAAMNETDEEFRDKQRAAWKAFAEVREQLGRKRAELAVKTVGRAAVEAYVAANPQGAVTVADDLLAAPDATLPALVNFGLRLAEALSVSRPDLCAALITRLEPTRALVRLNIGYAKLSLAQDVSWRSGDHTDLDALRTRRLDAAANDHVLAQEVRAALGAGRANDLLAYARTCLLDDQPVAKARGLAVLGFGPENAEADALIQRHEGEKGLCGDAARSARYAYQRSSWARHWRDVMMATDDPVDFWRASVQFLKIIDGRIDIWPPGPSAKLWTRFGFSLRSRIEHRVRLWSDKRESKLFGQTRPSDLIFNSDDFG